MVKTYALQSQAGRFDQSQHVATRSSSSAVVWLGRTRWQPMWLRGSASSIYGFGRRDSDRQGRPFGYERRRRSRSPATPQRRGCLYGLCRSCTAQHDLGHSSTCRPLSPLGLASDPGLDELECGSRLDSEAAPAAVPLRPRSTCLSGRLIFTVALCRTVSTGAQSPQNNRPPASAPHRADRYSFPIVLANRALRFGQ